MAGEAPVRPARGQQDDEGGGEALAQRRGRGGEVRAPGVGDGEVLGVALAVAAVGGQEDVGEEEEEREGDEEREDEGLEFC